MQHTGAYGNQDDGVGVLNADASSSKSNGTVDTKFQRHSPRRVGHKTTCGPTCKCVLVGSETEERMVSSFKFGERKRHPLRSNRALAGHH